MTLDWIRQLGRPATGLPHPIASPQRGVTRQNTSHPCKQNKIQLQQQQQQQQNQL